MRAAALAGMVDLRPGIVAGNGAGAGQAVTMVPVETIRAFLQAQHVARGHGRRADQSIGPARDLRTQVILAVTIPLRQLPTILCWLPTFRIISERRGLAYINREGSARFRRFHHFGTTERAFLFQNVFNKRICLVDVG